jgi:hypothetical protein
MEEEEEEEGSGEREQRRHRRQWVHGPVILARCSNGATTEKDTAADPINNKAAISFAPKKRRPRVRTQRASKPRAAVQQRCMERMSAGLPSSTARSSPNPCSCSPEKNASRKGALADEKTLPLTPPTLPPAPAPARSTKMDAGQACAGQVGAGQVGAGLGNTGVSLSSPKRSPWSHRPVTLANCARTVSPSSALLVGAVDTRAISPRSAF